MSQDDFIITTYLLVDKFYRQVVTTKLRKKGFEPALSDVEIITIQIVGEFMGLNDDKKMLKTGAVLGGIGAIVWIISDVVELENNLKISKMLTPTPEGIVLSF